MNYTYLGNTGVQVSRLCFGTMLFGGEADEAESAALFNYCLDVGINFFDCANVYQSGRSEEILGKLMAGKRNDLIITSKFFGQMGSDRNARGGSRRNIRHAVEASLRRLNTDYLDIYFIHHFDHHTPLEETLRGLDELVQQGKILYPAASNYAAWQVMKALGVSARHGWARYECIQPMYNLVKRQAEVELLPMAQAENLGVIPYNPLGAGLLTGKYGREKRPEIGRLVENKMYASRYSDPMLYEVAERFVTFAQARGYDPAALALAWVGSHPAVTAPIVGARSLAQLKSSLKALEIPMTAEFRAEISALSPEPPLATDRSEER